ncbi:hypothetical protein D9615_003825 [Tricholomella constricta]|uniref:Uncharacterized protein n=1 Tax=Tricholomella constricta TaxID=117010 RepID=A0A8H5HIL6_9AGAR|nr:hypothetical protein D9615_003825 [Tricholomella constricta]
MRHRGDPGGTPRGRARWFEPRAEAVDDDNVMSWPVSPQITNYKRRAQSVPGQQRPSMAIAPIGHAPRDSGFRTWDSGSQPPQASPSCR